MRVDRRELPKLGSRLSMCLVVALAASVIASNARAFDFFGLWGSDETPPPVSRTAISYAVTIEVEDGDTALKNAVTDTSSLYKLRKDPPPDGDALARPETQCSTPAGSKPSGHARASDGARNARAVIRESSV